MKITFGLGWGKAGVKFAKAFSFLECASLVELYKKRIAERGLLPEVLPAFDVEKLKIAAKDKKILWLCHPAGELLSSEEISKKLQKVMNSGADLVIAIGGDNGFSKKDISDLNPQLLWSFGKLTLPHELATVIASEQIYRALSIQRNEPYHRS